jgi:hypothetical protein
MNPFVMVAQADAEAHQLYRAYQGDLDVQAQGIGPWLLATHMRSEVLQSQPSAGRRKE